MGSGAKPQIKKPIPKTLCNSRMLAHPSGSASPNLPSEAELLRRISSLREKISQTAQAILDARAKYPDSSLADLYDPLTMPPDLRAAHAANDRAVLAAYGLRPDTPEPEIVAHLFKLYAEKTERENRHDDQRKSFKAV